MPLFGTIAIWTALAAIVGSIICYLAANAVRARAAAADRLACWGRRAFYLAALGIFCAAATLGTLLVTHRFDVAYVYDHSALGMAPLYWFPSFWSGQEGSFLLWAFWTSVLGIVLAKTSGAAERRVMPIFSMVLVFLATMLIANSPFLPTVDQLGIPITPKDGLGLNPNLENYWMVIHPPTLFLGFSSLAVPFAFALSALFWKDWTGWMRRAVPWGLFGFAVLGLAMMMGGYWAYEMLGWGGFWEWDPVENGPFIPWIGLIAFLHVAQVHRARGGFNRPTLFFALLPFMAAMYESFMTRSGILTDFSVHSFSELGGSASKLLLGALIFVVAAALAALLWRNRELGKRDAGSSSVLDSPATREYGYLIAVVLLTLVALVAAIGMSAPLLTKIGVHLHMAKYSASVSEDYHNKVMFPLAVLLSIGMGIGPYLIWRGRGEIDTKRLVTAYGVAVIGGISFIVLARYLGTGLTGMKLVPQLILFTSALFAIVANLILLVRRLPIFSRRATDDGVPSMASRSAAWTIGGLLSHIGGAVLLLGIVCLVVFARKDLNVQLFKGMSQGVLNGRYAMTYIGQSSNYETDKNNEILFDVKSSNGKEKFVARLPFALRSVEGGGKKLFGHPAIVHHLGGDLYLALKDGPEQFYPNGRYVEKLKLGATQKYGAYTIQFVKFERDMQAAALMQSGQIPARFPVWADLKVTYKGQTTLVKPQSIMLRDTPDVPETPEVKLPGGWLISFQSMNAGSADSSNPNAGAMTEAGSFILRPPGPVIEGFEIDVTTRPMISFVWIGTLILFAGGLIGMRRSIIENRLMPVPDSPESSAPPTRKKPHGPRGGSGAVVTAKPQRPLTTAGRN